MKFKFLNQFKKVNNLLVYSRNVLISSHEDPDADAVGSILAVSLALKKLNLQTYCYLSDFPVKVFSFLPHSSEIKTEIPQGLNFDIFFGLDYGDFRRLKIPAFANYKNLVTIDHHLGDQRGRIKIIEPQFSSTCEMIYWWLKENPPLKLGNNIQSQIDKKIATCLLSGIVGDTGGFAHASTTPKTLEAASDLLSKKVLLNEIVNYTLSGRSFLSLESTQAFGKVLSRIKILPKYSLVYSWLSHRDLGNSSLAQIDFEGIASLISKEPTADCALFLIEYEKGKVKGSLRSEPFKKRRVDKIAKKMGGGGHFYAAGFKQEGSIEQVLKKVVDLIE